MSFKNIITIIILFFCSISINAHTNFNNTFISPFKFPLLLSANFGELRGNHFHGGIDIKTGGVVGKPVHCIADGYVSRVLVMEGGYGNALFINHYNGYTSVYGHIKSFAPSVENIIKEYQLKHEIYSVDLKFEPDYIKFKTGDVIALSGNEGLSFGPHLHLEIRDTKTNEYINPLLFYKDIIVDNRAPVAQFIAIYPEKGAGVVDGNQTKKLIPISNLSKSINAWGKIGIGIKAFDFMTNTSNHYGIHQITLFLEDKIIFKSQIDRVKADENRRINGYTDFEELKQKNRWIIRSHSLPGNHLNFVEQHQDRGLVDINQERDYNFTYEISDIYGNKKRYNFTITGKKNEIKPITPKRTTLFWSRLNMLQEPGFQLVIPKGMLYDDAELNWSVRRDSSALSNIYQINNVPIPLHNYCSLMIGVKNMPIEDSTKYYIASLIGKRKVYIGGKYEKGWVKADIRELGTYTVEIDTIAPRVVPLSKKQWKSGNIKFKIYDTETGIKSYKVYIDGEFHLFSYSLKNNMLAIKYPTPLKRGVAQKIEVIIEDKCGNIRKEKYII